ncbi:unnamed protein product [Acanthoscelides obtectus]|uniref:Uncharacterized protein n=1 Tax=Acanthoscelides obtectus TaxID=200917 RepID=A0A9P0KZ55_ACAOB|nr:unnamed protein product [Acanthoscelides obtectus]CAK1646290.1 hypothetical protein AOBTE_LOCUS14559 [Acanthoscelides obtectus]
MGVSPVKGSALGRRKTAYHVRKKSWCWTLLTTMTCTITCTPARWSSWSEWSECTADCTKIRRRQCIPGNGGKKTCSGKDTQSTPCSAEQCRTMELTRVREG